MHSVMAKGARSLLALAFAAMTCLPSGIALIGMASSAMGETLPETIEVNAPDANPALDNSENKSPNGAGANDNDAVGSDATKPDHGASAKETDAELYDKGTDGNDNHAVGGGRRHRCR